MATIRQGYLDDYSQQNGNVGIGTSVSNEKLEIIGGTTVQELNVTGISTFAHVSGFIKKHTDYAENADMTAGDSGTLSGEIVVGAGLTMTVGTAATSSQGSVDSLKVLQMFQPPSGTTNQRPPAKTGAIFYNFDFKTIEFFDGNSWRQVDNTTRSGRGIIAGVGGAGAQKSDIGSIQIMSQGNEVDFGDLTQARGYSPTGASSTRGIIFGGSIYPAGATPFSNVIDYVTIHAGGNGIDFGDLLSTNTTGAGGCSSSTRALTASRYPHQNVIEYVQINTLGNSIDFGDRTVAVAGYPCAVASPTRGVWAGGYLDASPLNSATVSTIDFVTISSLGNAAKFGDLTKKRGAIAGCSSPVRGLYAGGNDWNPNAGAMVNTIEYITIGSTGDASDFGDLTIVKRWGDAVGSATAAGAA